MLYKYTTGVSILIALVALSLWASDNHNGHTPTANHTSVSKDGTPVEGGQATFAAVVEIVALLEQDENTNWKEVDINGLRSHLLDMHHLMLGTEASQTLLGNTQIRFEVRGTEVSIPSIHKMVPAHSRFIEQSRGWEIESALSEEGAVLTIDVDDNATVNRLDALGFYGFMALDSHHQAHHYQMALGNSH